MSIIGKVESRLPPGFRFHPKDEELICDYLMKKVTSSESSLFIEVDLNKCEPWDIPEMACVGGKEWYFYNQRDRKYATGVRTNRATLCGYWKATGKDRAIMSKGNSIVNNNNSNSIVIGMRKTLVFYQGRAPKGKKTDWVMHEFRLEGPLSPPISSLKVDWALCRVFNKSRPEGVGIGKGKGRVNMESGWDISNDTINNNKGSSTLPPLVDSHISFDQTQSELDEYEQVPCFSNIFSQMDPNTPSKTSSAPIFGGLPDLPTFTCDKMVIKAVLNQLTNNMDDSLSFGQGTSSETYFSQLSLPPIWNHYF